LFKQERYLLLLRVWLSAFTGHKYRERHNVPGTKIKPLTNRKLRPANVLKTILGTKRPLGRHGHAACPARRGAAAAGTNRQEPPDSPQPQHDEQHWDGYMADDAAPAAAPAAAAAQTSAGLYSRHTVAGAAATAAARPERTRAQEANEDNWKEFFDGNVSRFQTSLVIQAQLQQDYSVALQQQVTCSVTQGACSKCGLCLQDCSLVRHVEVIVIDIAICCTVQVPVVECSR
jgi:hypothetical protein